MEKEELLNYEGKISELREVEREEAISFYKSLIPCYSEEDKINIFEASQDGVGDRYVDFILANLSKYTYQNNKDKYASKVKSRIKTR